jgi:AcrR family transcriptional regulator
MTSQPNSRPYRKIERARKEEETRRAIAQAAVELHGTVGPAKTTVTDVARLAGVSRMTVYNHYPTEIDLFRACSSHWAAENPFPDPGRWAAIDDPADRLVTALKELYAWYRLRQDMLGNIFRDAPLLPALGEVMSELWSSYESAMVGSLSQGRQLLVTEGEDLDAALRLVLSFGTWHNLAQAGLDDERAAELAARMVRAVGRAAN